MGQTIVYELLNNLNIKIMQVLTIKSGQATEGEINDLLWFDETINDMIYNDLDDENEDI